MSAKSLREYAQEHKISYEAVRKLVNRYQEDLEGHISTQNRTKYLDEEAQKILDEKRRVQPIVILEETSKETIEELRAEIKRRDEMMIELQSKLIELQESQITLIEAKTRADMLLEDKEKKEAELKDKTEEVIELRVKLTEAEKEAQSFKKTFLGLYKKS